MLDAFLKTFVLKKLRSWKSTVVETLYPAVCLICHAATENPDSLCAGCWKKLRFIEAPVCQRLGVPFPVDLGKEMVSPAALADPPNFDRARAAVLYEGGARQLVHRLKYQDQHNLAKGMAHMMVRAGSDLLDEADVIIPVPLHVTRLWRRRFNQSMLLARYLSHITEKPCDPFLLLRVKRTAPQYSHTRSQRKEALKGAFRVHTERRDQIDQRRILLIDDVLTTGATVNAATKVLLRAGAQAVDVLTFAMTPPLGVIQL